MKRQSKRATSSGSHHESPEPGEKLALKEEDVLTAPSMEQDDAEMDEDDLAGGGSALSPPCGLGEKKRRLALEQVRALERCFETDNKLDPERKARIARDLGLQPRQVAVWFQNRRARWKTKQLERDFAALRARHDALRADCDALRRDKDALAAEVRELRQKLSNTTGAAVNLQATGNDAAEEVQATVAAAAAACKDGSSDSDSSVVFNDVEASPYSGAALERPPQQPGFLGFGACGSSPFMDSSAATLAPCSSLPAFDTKWHHGSTYPYDSYKCGGYGFSEEWLAGSDVLGSDGAAAAAAFFAEEPASFAWCGSGAGGWE